jgi:hypothetical protein
MKHWLGSALWVLLLTQQLGQTCQADQYVQWQGYEIHYTTLSSRLIPADVAASHDIIRADNRIVTNISIRKDGLPIRASIRGTATNLLNQRQNLAFTEVMEQDAIYYLANQLVDVRDTLRFVLFVLPEGTNEPYELAFVRDYYQ